MLVIATAYEFLSLFTFVLGISIAVLAALRLWAQASLLRNLAEHLYIAFLALTVSLWSFLPILSNDRVIHPQWQWLLLLAMVLSISWYTIYVCNRIIPLLAKYRHVLWAGVLLLLIPFVGLLVTAGGDPVWTLTASLVVGLIWGVDAFLMITAAYRLKDKLYILAAGFMVSLAISYAGGLWLTSSYLHLITLGSLLCYVIIVSLAALDNAYLRSMHYMNQKVEEVRQELAAQTENIEDVVISLARTIDAKDKYTEGHTERVSQYAVFLGERLGLSDRSLETLRIGALIHDLGKIGIDLNILNKPGKLTEEEFAQIQLHPALGQQICSPLKALQEVGDIIRHHHEKLDGSGYPDGLQGDQISLNARIVAIADIFDALTTERSYRAALSVDEALDIMREEAAQGKLDSSILYEFEALLLDLGVTS
ncbi:MAG TPA: HD-GYP domain-containing protein [Syntrophomonadaceae bacterium]|nr:HD-GYP domain-containing protein [Syntrophomonadaceae bacterium]HQA07249.1 HD-GYP domain-containing protein [Syntrophomonadaceae bacterium]HQE22438.1 HD-GYP domain-containing protein [Syntrophomonadaceae bacterium]